MSSAKYSFGNLDLSTPKKNEVNVVNDHRDDDGGFAENMFLFCWAVVANMKEFIVDKTVDLIEMVNPSSIQDSESTKARKKKKAFLRRIKREMGYITPEKEAKRKAIRKKRLSVQIKREKSDDMEETPLSPISNLGISRSSIGESPRGADESKIENLEAELMFLKQQIAILNSTSQPSTKSSHNNASASIPPPPPPPPSFQSSIPHVTMGSGMIPPPPPPPPPPPAIKNTKKRTVASKPKAPEPTSRAMCFSELIEKAKTRSQRLKENNIRIETPKRREVEDKPITFQHELFAAIKRKFKNVNEEDDDEDDEHAESTLSDDDESTWGTTCRVLEPALQQSTN